MRCSPIANLWTLFVGILALTAGLAAPIAAQDDGSEAIVIDTTPAPANPSDFADDDIPFELASAQTPLARPSRLSERVQVQARAHRSPAKPKSRPKRRKSKLPTGQASIPAGCFWMGSPEGVGSENEHPRHRVCLSAFRMDRVPVLESDFEAATGQTPWTLCSGATCSRPDPDLPAWYVTWAEADSFCRGRKGRLPTEAEFEYAARAGDSGLYVWGDTLARACDYANFADLSLAKTLPGWSAFPCTDGNALIAPAGGRKPNAWGLYDMAGNVWQWTSDWYAADWYSQSASQDPTGPSEGTGRVMRGGSWLNGPTGGRVAYRDGFHPDERYSGAIGFRCVVPETR